MTKRITFVVQTPEFGGAEKHLRELLRRIDESVECVILCFGEDFYTEAMRGKANVRVIKLPQIKTHKLISFWKVFSQYPAGTIVLVKGVFEQYSMATYIAARLSRAGRLIALEHNMPEPLPGVVLDGGLRGTIKSLIGWRTRYVMEKKLQGHLAHVTICVSEAIRRALLKDYGYPANRTITIRNGIDLGYYGFSHEASGENCHGSARIGMPKTIVCAARLSSAKRLDLLLEALALLAKSDSDWRCLILGTGPLEKELRNQAVRLGLDHLVTFVGHVEDVRPYLRSADLFVLSSEKEGLPLALLEAMAFGVPPVVTDVGGTGETVIHGQNGLLVKARSVTDLGRAIGHLLSHHEERIRMGKAARLHIQQHFNIEESMARLKQVVCPPVPSELS